MFLGAWLGAPLGRGVDAAVTGAPRAGAALVEATGFIAKRSDASTEPPVEHARWRASCGGQGGFGRTTLGSASGGRVSLGPTSVDRSSCAQSRAAQRNVAPWNGAQGSLERWSREASSLVAALQPAQRTGLTSIWVSAAALGGYQVRRAEDAFASYDGAGTITIGTDATLDADDTVAQLVFHELCHALCEGKDARSCLDWGFGSLHDAEASMHEWVAICLQARLAVDYDVADLLAPTTPWRRLFAAAGRHWFHAVHVAQPGQHRVSVAKMVKALCAETSAWLSPDEDRGAVDAWAELRACNWSCPTVQDRCAVLLSAAFDDASGRRGECLHGGLRKSRDLLMTGD